MKLLPRWKRWLWGIVVGISRPGEPSYCEIVLKDGTEEHLLFNHMQVNRSYPHRFGLWDEVLEVGVNEESGLVVRWDDVKLIRFRREAKS